MFLEYSFAKNALFPLILFRLFQPLPAEFATAVQLVIEIILFEELVAAVLQSAFPPVLLPKDCTGIKGGCPFSRFVYLVEALPARRREGSGKDREAVFGSIACRFRQA